MIEGHLIICDSNVPWQGNRYSKHHLMSRLARHNDLVFMNTQVDACKYGREKGWGGVWNLGARFEQPADEALQVFTPLSLPYRGESRHLLAADQRYFTRQVRAVVKRYPGRDLILFIGNPWNVFLLDAFPERKCSIYHCSDDFPSLFGGGLGEKIAEREEKLIRSVDLVACSHPRLVRKCQALRDGDVHYLQHAVDTRFLRPDANFAEAQCPPDMAQIPRPRIGFVGSLDATIDFPLLRQVAVDCPDLSFVLVGAADEAHRPAVEDLVSLPSVHWLGRKPWADLPGYLWNFDVALIPFAMTDFTAAGSPLKQFEYLAAGLPIVSTNLDFADALRPHIRIAERPEEFAGAVREACREAHDPAAIRERKRVIQEGYTWDHRAEELSELIASRMHVPV